MVMTIFTGECLVAARKAFLATNAQGDKIPCLVNYGDHIVFLCVGDTTLILKEEEVLDLIDNLKSQLESSQRKK